MSMKLDALEKLKNSYSEGEKHMIQRTSKEAAIRRLREIEEEIMALPDLDHFPDAVSRQ
jgi:hypothetical protein